MSWDVWDQGQFGIRKRGNEFLFHKIRCFLGKIAHEWNKPIVNLIFIPYSRKKTQKKGIF